MAISASYPNLRPTLSLDFANAGRMDPRVTFTRASTATYFDETGILRSAAIDAPRFDYNPATLAARGFLVEEARTNSLTYSAEFDDAAWNKLNLNTTGTPAWVNVEVAPNGATTADKIIEDTATGVHRIAGSITPADNTTYTFSVFAKAAERTLIQLVFVAKTGGFRSRIFDLSNGTSSQSTEAGYTTVPPIFGIQPVGNGWYRCWVGGDSLTGAVVTNNARAHLMTGTSSASYTGDDTSGLYIWGAQLEAGAFPTSYIPTTTTALTRSADVASVNTLSPWYNATETTLYTEFNTNVPNTVASSAIIAGFDDGTANNRFGNFYNSSPAVLAAAQSIAGVASLGSGLVGASGLTLSNVQKQATRFQAGSYAISANGLAAVTNSFASGPPTVNTLRIGLRPGGAQANMWLRRITYYPRRLSNAELVSITS